ncbi:MAG: PAS domain S-box protein, partial [Rhodoferax sp.]
MAHQDTTAGPSDDVADLSPQALRALLQNLRLHQIELEMQNEELRCTQAALDTAQARYFDFYDLAPVGYVTVSDKALILQANLSTAELLGVPRAKLIGKALPGFLFAPDAGSFFLLCKQALASGSAQTTELRMRRPDREPFWAKLHAIAATGDNGTAVVRMVVSDITSRKRLEERLISSEADTKAILDGASDAVFIANSAGRYQYVNAMATQLLGFSREELLGMGVGDLHPVEDRLETIHLFKQLLSIGILRYEPTLKRRDGSTVCVELNATVLADGRLYAACRDITERRQLEQAAKEASEDKFRLVADNTSDGIVIFGADSRIQYVSPAYVKQLGYSEAEERSRSPDQIYALIHPEDRDALFAGLERAIAEKTSDLLYSYRILHQRGHYIWREDNARFQYDGAGHYAGACVVTRDITQRRQVELELLASDLRYQWLIEELPVGAVIHGPRCEISRINARALDLLGLTEDQVLGKTSLDLQWNVIHEDGSPFPGSTHPAAQVFASRQPVRDVVMGVFRPTTQDRVWLLVNAHPQMNADSSLQLVVVMFSDITERINARAAMQELNRHLTQSRQQLRRLVALNETTLEKEKRHIAREVHDELGQVLTALRMELSLAIIRHA